MMVPSRMHRRIAHETKVLLGTLHPSLTINSPRAFPLRLAPVLRDRAPFAKPSMLSKLFVAWLLLSLCVVIHAIGLTAAVRWMQRRTGTMSEGFWPATWMLVSTAGWTLLLHLVQIAVWAFFYAWQGAIPGLSAAFYFSGVTYTTTGYGDLVLSEEWRLVGGIEALTGILMCGLSTGFFFAVFSRVIGLSGKNDPPA
ncbi:MAG: two pore domain potassium channel family protein [Verrucomicrobiaceae bacterium]|nr:MAG: two pore domain potassium channel family protein [Verrucomicrobiaceae bacterium]